jgi:hypothetical protein
MATKTTQNQTPAAERTDELQLLSDSELSRVVGGRPATQIHQHDIVITKRMDASSPF